MSDRGDLHDLYRRFDGVNGDRRLAWYGQERALGKSHAEAIDSTAKHFQLWVEEFWPKRGLEVPTWR